MLLFDQSLLQRQYHCRLHCLLEVKVQHAMRMQCFHHQLQMRLLHHNRCIQLTVSLQVLGEVFNCLHRAQLGSAATAGLDPQLPQLVRVPRASSASSLAGLATPSADPSARGQPASSMAQDIFGQKVQVYCLLVPAVHVATSQAASLADTCQRGSRLCVRKRQWTALCYLLSYCIHCCNMVAI